MAEIPNVDSTSTWSDRIDLAVASWLGQVSFSADLMHSLPLRVKLDRVFKDAGVRDLVVENDRLQVFESVATDLQIENERLEHERNFLQRELGFKNTMKAENQRLREDGYREGFDCGFTTAMAAVRQAIERDLAIHENMEIMRGRRPSEALAGDTE